MNRRHSLRILVAGATGVLGRATLPHLAGHEGRWPDAKTRKLELLRALGVGGVVCDVYDYEELLRAALVTRPHIVVNFLTDLSFGNGDANNRVRREGGSNLLSAAIAAEALRLVVESVSFPSRVPPRMRSSRWSGQRLSLHSRS